MVTTKNSKKTTKTKTTKTKTTKTTTTNKSKRKSKAQIARMMKRAAERGEEYVPAPIDEGRERDRQSRRKFDAYRKYRKDMIAVERRSTEMKAKERRSAKRKAEAIALEESGCTTLDELVTWYQHHHHEEQQQQEEEQQEEQDNRRPIDTNAAEAVVLEEEEDDDDDDKISNDSKTKSSSRSSQQRQKARKGDAPAKAPPEAPPPSSRNPYVVFVGQLSYSTTAEGLLAHIRKELGEEGEFAITDESFRVRLLTDAKTNKSRGMAFVETNDPELLYGCLKMHHTHLDGRRINVERSAGGNKSSETRKAKLRQYRRDQEQFVSDTVDKMIEEHQRSGELRDDELDDAVLALCKRHSPAVVEATLTRYLESNGRDMDNPSAYFNYLISKIAQEGLHEGKGGGHKKHDNKNKTSGVNRKKGNPSSGVANAAAGERETGGQNAIGKKRLRQSSEFAQAGVDMSVSATSAENAHIIKIFPSMSRGRGRGGRGAII